jgi:hypothetical protein
VIKIFDEQRRKEFEAAGSPLVPEDQLMMYEDYLDISRRRHLTRLPLFKLQAHMLQDLLVAERMLGQYREELKKLIGRTPSEADEEPDTDDETDDEQIPSQQNAEQTLSPEQPRERNGARYTERSSFSRLRREPSGKSATE